MTLYRREDPVERQLQGFEGLSPSGLVALAESASVQEVSSETLVGLTRAFIRGGREDFASRVLRVLCRRVAGRTARHLDIWGVTIREAREDLTQDILRVLLECVVSVEPDQEFWECRFWTCFDRRARTLLRDAMRARAELSLDETGESLSPALRDTSVSVELKTETALALEALPEPVRTAFYLKHYGGYKEESSMPEELTIASILGVTGRTVRNYLRRAENILVDWRENHALS